MATDILSAVESVLLEVRDERGQQDAKWGEQNHGDTVWLTVLSEEVGEAAAELLHSRAIEQGHDRHTPAHLALTWLRGEIVQVAAVAVAWIEAIDRRGDGYRHEDWCGGAHGIEASCGGHVGRGEVRGPVPAAARDMEPGPRDRWTPSCGHASPVFGCGPCEEGRT